jgi:hypothetical protein
LTRHSDAEKRDAEQGCRRTLTAGSQRLAKRCAERNQTITSRVFSGEAAMHDHVVPSRFSQPLAIFRAAAHESPSARSASDWSYTSSAPQERVFASAAGTAASSNSATREARTGRMDARA